MMINVQLLVAFVPQDFCLSEGGALACGT